MPMKTKTQPVNQITEGIIWKQLLIFFFPIVFGTFFQQLYNTVDTVIVGHFLGKSALASVGGSSTQIVNLVVGFFTGLSSGASVLIAQFYGAQNKRAVQESLHTAYTFSIIGSIAVSIPGILLAPCLLRWMNTPAELIPDSALYLRIYFAGILFVFIFNIGSSILRAIGDSRHPLYYLIICCLLNIVLDILCVVQLKMGVAGAAAATLLSQAASAALVTGKLMKSGGLMKLSLRKLKFHANALKSLLRIGLPAGFQSIMYSLTNVAIQAALNGFGTDTVAAWSVYGKLDALFWMISGAIGISITTFVGQNFGARKYDRVKKSVRVCLEIDFLISAILVVFFLAARVPLFKIFTNDTDVIRIGCDMMTLIAPCYIFFIFIEVLSGALRGIGDILIPTLITLGGVCILRILWLVGVLQIHPTVSAISLSYPVTWAATGILFILYYLYRKKRVLQ